MSPGTSVAVLVVDVSRKRADPNLETSYPSVVDATQSISELVDSARENDTPVFFSRGGKSYHLSEGSPLSRTERGAWVKQNQMREESEENSRNALEIAPQLSPREDEVVITKSAPSPFFNTMLPVYLSSHGVDTLVVTGMQASGCVRAAVTDAFSHDYWVVLPEECVADKRNDAYEYHMDEMDKKYADVVSMSDAGRYIRGESNHE